MENNVPTPPKIKISTTFKKNSEESNQENSPYYGDFKEELIQAAEKINKGKKSQIYKAKNIQKISTPSSNPQMCSYCNKEVETSIFKYHMESHPSKILDWLYLGSYNNATNKKELEYANVKYVVNCAQECKNLFEKDFTYKHFKLSVKKY
jgi:hypothetical protein